MKTYYRISILTFMCLTILFACTPSVGTKTENSPQTVTVSVLPEKYFVDRIGGMYVQTNVMVGPGESPHSYEPKARQMAALSNSVVFFAIGVEFENAWLERITSANPGLHVVDLSSGITKLTSAETDHPGEMDPHIWTSPQLGKTIAKQIAAVLIEIDPQHTNEFQANLSSLIGDIEQLQVEIKKSITQMDTHQFMVFHPAWGYFANEFGLEQIPIEINGAEPSASELAQLIDTAKKDHIRVIFAQPEFSTKSADYIASEIGGKVILISPLAKDWLENLRLVSQTFADSL
jgi:zinc transport system substrate-binding protein